MLDGTQFVARWHDAAYTTVGLFWTAFWAFGLGYMVSGMIQVFVTRDRMQSAMGDAGPKSVLLGTVFGFISSSCSFSALSTTRSLYAKGAGLVPALAFLLASTNLVVELGIVIAMFLSWQFVLGEYLGGMLLIATMWILVRLTLPSRLDSHAREIARSHEADDASPSEDWRELITSRQGWQRVADRYVREWFMVWKDVTIGFTVAGIVAAFVPHAFFEALFLGSGATDPTFGQVLLQALVGPVVAFFTFIGSMGNIPLAAVLFSNGVGFAGIMAFIFSDLVVFPVLRINAKYLGWRMAIYIALIFLVSLVVTAVGMHYGFSALGILPDAAVAQGIVEREYFSWDHSTILGLVFVAVSFGAIVWKAKTAGLSWSPPADIVERILLVVATLSIIWLLGGLVVGAIV